MALLFAYVKSSRGVARDVLSKVMVVCDTCTYYFRLSGYVVYLGADQQKFVQLGWTDIHDGQPENGPLFVHNECESEREE